MSAHVISKRNPTFHRLIDDLASGDELTLVIGAGASLDAGLPSWAGLVRSLLETGFSAEIRSHSIEPPPGATYETLAQAVIEGRDLIEAATLARFLHGDNRTGAIKTALYEQAKTAPEPGRIYKAVTALCGLLGGRIRIVTTNFDDILEQSISKNTKFEPQALIIGPDGDLTPSKKYPKGDIQVVHLHGMLPYDGEPEGPIILDERDFSVESIRPPGSVLPEVLRPASPTLFLGLSLTDPNIVAACHLLSSDEARPWYGLFLRGGDSPHVTTLGAKRLRAMKITPLHLASFGQISQVLYELMHRTLSGANYWDDTLKLRYGLRLEEWFARYCSSRRDLFGGDRFDSTHDSLHEALVSHLDDLTTGSGALHDLLDEEHFGLHLWVRSPSNVDLGQLRLIAASSHRYRQPWALSSQEMYIANGTGVTAVDAVYFGCEQRRNKGPRSADRWQGVVAVPIELSQSPENFLISGVMTISSTRPMASSALLDSASAVAVDLLDHGAELLSPRA